MAFVTTRMARPIGCTFLLLAAVAACGGETRTDAARDTASATVSPSTATASTMANSALDDTSVVRVIAAVDRGEAAAGRRALLKATRSDVKAYGQMLMEEHEADLTKLERIASAANISLDGTLAEAGSGNPAVVQLHQNLELTMSQLHVATGANFDRQFISSQLAGHQQVIALLRQNEARLQDSDIRTHVAGMSALLEKHLERARQIEQQLRGESTAATGTAPPR